MSAIDWEHAPEIAKPTYEELEAMCWELTEQNAELRKERDFYFKQVSDNGERAHRAIDALNAENDALREFVRDARRNCRERSDIDCYGCALHADGACMAYVIAERLGVDA